MQEKQSKEKYTFINVRVKPSAKVRMNQVARSRGLSLSRAVEELIERELDAGEAPRPVVRGSWFSRLFSKFCCYW